MKEMWKKVEKTSNKIRRILSDLEFWWRKFEGNVKKSEKNVSTNGIQFFVSGGPSPEARHTRTSKHMEGTSWDEDIFLISQKTPSD